MRTTTHFYHGRERELLALIKNPTTRLDGAACIGVDTDLYHPEGAALDDVSGARCATCPVRMGCLALALRAEDPDARSGWYGGLGPDDRDTLATELALVAEPGSALDRAPEAFRLRAAGLSVREIAARLACSRRTVQRYFSESRRSEQSGPTRR